MQFDIIFPVKAFNIIHEGYLRFQTKFERGIQEKARWLRSSGGYGVVILRFLQIILQLKYSL